MSRTSRHQTGFTLVELIAVVVLLGILAALAAPRFFDRRIFDTRMFADQSRALIRQAQKVAIAQNRNVYVRLNGSSVALCFTASCSGAAELVRASSGSNSGSAPTKAACVVGSYQSFWACEGVPSGGAYSASASSFYFDALGQPFAAGDAPPTTVSTFAKLTITITGDGSSRAIVVEPGTGYVH